MSMINILAWLIIAIILISPFILIILLIKIIKKLIQKGNSKKQVKHENNTWKSEWIWNEETKLWEHPLSARGTAPNEKQSHNATEENTNFNIKKPDSESPKNQTNAKVEDNRPKQEASKEPRIIYTYVKPELKIQDMNVQHSEELDFTSAYQRKPLFTKNEWQNYKKLRDIAEIRGFVICPKVRLFDLVEPRNDKKRKLTYRYKIQAKHVDFVICDKNMNIKAILELDDNSHYDPDRIKRDNFVNTILLNTGYTVIHTKYIEDRVLDLI